MSQDTLHTQLQALQKAENQTLVRHLEIELKEPETKQAKSGRDVTYIHWRYRDPSSKEAEWKNRSTPIFTDEAKLLLAQGPYKQGELYKVSAQKNEQDYWQWSGIEKAPLDKQREGAEPAKNLQPSQDPFAQIKQNAQAERSHGLER